MTNTSKYEKYSLEYAASMLANTMMTKYKTKHPENTQLVSSDELVRLVSIHSLGAAAAGLGISWLPALGSLAATGAMTMFIWSMYLHINDCLGLRFSKVALKTILSAVLSNMGQGLIYIAGTLTISTLLSLTGLGAVASSVMMAALDYAVVMVGGILYLKLITALVESGEDPQALSEDQLKNQTESIVQSENIREMLKTECENYKAGRKDGSITGKETVELHPEAEAKA